MTSCSPARRLGPPNVVQMRTSDRIRPAEVSAKRCAIMPPSEAPTTCAVSWPEASRTAAASPAICVMA